MGEDKVTYILNTEGARWWVRSTKWWLRWRKTKQLIPK